MTGAARASQAGPDNYLAQLSLIVCPRCGRRHRMERSRRRRDDHRGWGAKTCRDCRSVLASEPDDEDES